jgi:hypothetical protein
MEGCHEPRYYTAPQEDQCALLVIVRFPDLPSAPASILSIYSFSSSYYPVSLGRPHTGQSCRYDT